MSDVRKPNSKSMLKSVILVRPVLCAAICHTGQTGIEHRSDPLDLSKSKSSPPDLSGSFTGFQSRLPDMSNIGLV
jgi:hypothetical protein